MDITLVNMNMLYIKYTDGTVRRQCHLPLGPLYLISAMERSGISVDFRDYQLVEDEKLFSPETLCAFLQDPAPVIGISCMANLLPFILMALPLIKETYPGCTIMLGGVGCTDIETQVMERFPGIDIIHRGEGEVSVPILVNALKNKTSLRDVPNIFYRESGAVHRNAQAPRIADPDAIPRPSYDGLDFKKYVGHNILGSRGCPYPCTFCSIAPVWDHKTCSRSNENIIAEMREMREKYGVRQFLFQDEFFASGPQRLKDFSARLMKEDMGVSWKSFARVDMVDEETLGLMADSGCVEVRFGIESGSDKILSLTRKGFTADAALKTVSTAKKIVKGVDAFYVWGFHYETMDDFSESVFQMITFRGMGVNILPSLLTYLPQTAIYRELEDKSRLEFCDYLLPEYMITGIERRLSARVIIDSEYAGLVDFIIANRDLFPGFFHVDIENNILPKLQVLEEFEFYKPDNEKSCGAHSPS